MGVKFGNYLPANFIVEKMEGKKIAIDASNIILTFLKQNYRKSSKANSSKYYRNLDYYSKNQNLITDRTQRAISHLYGVFYRTIKLLEGKCLPIYCFDGVPDPLKRNSTKDKINDFKYTKLRYENYLKQGQYEKAKQVALSSEFLWQNCIKETRELLNKMGIPYIDSPSEAEAQCAQLLKIKSCDFVGSTDFDCLLYGAQNTLKIKGFQGKKIKGTIYNLKEILKKINLNRFQLIDLSIIMGNDYFNGIPGIGFKIGTDLLYKYNSLENIINSTEKSHHIFKIRNKIDIKKIRKIHSLFLYPQVIRNNLNLELNFPKPNGIMNLMCIDHHLSKERVEKGIKRLIKAYKLNINS